MRIAVIGTGHVGLVTAACFLDGRNALDRERLLAEGFEYLGMGR